MLPANLDHLGEGWKTRHGSRQGTTVFVHTNTVKEQRSRFVFLSSPWCAQGEVPTGVKPKPVPWFWINEPVALRQRALVRPTGLLRCGPVCGLVCGPVWAGLSQLVWAGCPGSGPGGPVVQVGTVPGSVGPVGPFLWPSSPPNFWKVFGKIID